MLGRFCSGIAIVTGSVGRDPVGMTAQSFASLSPDPPLVLFLRGHDVDHLAQRSAVAGTFCVNILSEGQEPVSRSFAVPGAGSS